jgi:hypothetical protein
MVFDYISAGKELIPGSWAKYGEVWGGRVGKYFVGICDLLILGGSAVAFLNGNYEGCASNLVPYATLKVLLAAFRGFDL